MKMVTGDSDMAKKVTSRKNIRDEEKTEIGE